MRINGLDELSKRLNQLADNAKRLDGKHNVPLTVLFNDGFMRRYTSFSTAQELFDKSGFQLNSVDDFEAIPTSEWDTYIKNVTKFSSWEDMLAEATQKYVARELGF